jgi:hypothetical protein
MMVQNDFPGLSEFGQTRFSDPSGIQSESPQFGESRNPHSESTCFGPRSRIHAQILDPLTEKIGPIPETHVREGPQLFCCGASEDSGNLTDSIPVFGEMAISDPDRPVFKKSENIKKIAPGKVVNFHQSRSRKTPKKCPKITKSASNPC